jgi:hypothetical protein
LGRDIPVGIRYGYPPACEAVEFPNLRLGPPYIERAERAFPTA